MKWLNFILQAFTGKQCLIGTKWMDMQTGITFELTKILEKEKMVEILHIHNSSNVRKVIIPWDHFYSTYVLWDEE